ncbi:hypothetical protein MBLNU457_7582t1 [Dothideomycetes sp. NU457]
MDSPTSPGASRGHSPSSMTAPTDRQDSYTTFMSKHHTRLTTNPSPTTTNPITATSPNSSGICSPTSDCSTVTSPDAAPMPAHSTSFFASQAPGPTTPSIFSSSAARTMRSTSLDLPLIPTPRTTTDQMKPRHSSVTSLSASSSPIASSSESTSARRTSAESARRYSAMTESFASLSPRHSVGSGRRWVRGGSVDERKREWERERRVAEEMELERRFLGV